MLTLSLDAPARDTGRLSLTGHLDEVGARRVLHAAADVVRSGCTQLEVDLAGVASYDEDAIYAVVGCCRLARYLPRGVALVVDSAAGAALADAAGAAPHPAEAHAPGTMVTCPAC